MNKVQFPMLSYAYRLSVINKPILLDGAKLLLFFYIRNNFRMFYNINAFFLLLFVYLGFFLYLCTLFEQFIKIIYHYDNTRDASCF